MDKKTWEAYLPTIIELLKLAAQSKALPLIEKSERGKLVRDLYDHWVMLGGRNVGHPIRSVRQMREWLGPDKVIRSLEPKLSGRTNLGRNDAETLFELFLTRWHPGEKLGQEQPYVDGVVNDLVAQLLDYFYILDGSADQRGFLLPDKRTLRGQFVQEHKTDVGREAREVIAELFSESDGLITVSRNRTVSRSPESVRRFQDLFDELRRIDSHDEKRRILIWIVDIGRRQSDDAALIALRNLDALAFQFRATALTENPERKLRWKWLQDHTVIIVGSLQSADIERCYKSLKIECSDSALEIPWFNANLLQLSETPDSWVSAKELRILYGDYLENLQERAFSILPDVSDWKSGQRDSQNHAGEFRYFGHKPPDVGGRDAKSSASRLAIELPAPSLRHNDAFLLAYAAACYRFGIDHEKYGIFPPGQSFNYLKKHNFAVLRLSEFLDITSLVVEK